MERTAKHITEYFWEAATLFLQHILFAPDLQWQLHSLAPWCYVADVRHDIKYKRGRKACNCLQMGYIPMYDHAESVLPGLWQAFQTLWCFDFFHRCQLVSAPTCIYMYCVLPDSLCWWSGSSVVFIVLQREQLYTQIFAIWIRYKADQSCKFRAIFFLYYCNFIFGQVLFYFSLPFQSVVYKTISLPSKYQ